MRWDDRAGQRVYTPSTRETRERYKEVVDTPTLIEPTVRAKRKDKDL